MIPELKKSIWRNIFETLGSNPVPTDYSECSSAGFGRVNVDNVIDYHKPSDDGKGSQVACLVGQLEDGRYFYLERHLGTSDGCCMVSEDFVDLYQFGFTDTGRVLLSKAQERVSLFNSLDALFLSNDKEQNFFDRSMVPHQVVISCKDSQMADKLEEFWKTVGLSQFKKWLNNKRE